MKKLSKYRAIWMMRTHLRLTLIMLSLIIGGVTGQLFVDYFASASVALKTCIRYAAVFAVSLVPTLLYHARIKSLCRYWHAMPVISTDVGCTNYTQLKNAVKRTVRLHKLSDKCRYGKLHKRYGIRIFLHNCAEETYGYFESAESTVRELNRRKNIPDVRMVDDRNNADSFNHYARINVFAFEYGAARYQTENTGLSCDSVVSLTEKWEEMYGSVHKLRLAALEGRLPTSSATEAVSYLTSVVPG